jgi:cytochrome c oxidase subunit 3
VVSKAGIKKVKEVAEKRLEPAKLGILLFIAAEMMFFAGLISAFLVFRFSPAPWPPEGQPRLPITMTAINTALLILSAFTFYKALAVLRQGKKGMYLFLLTATFLLGIQFLVIQGNEWMKMVQFGLSVHANPYGGFFYGLVGLHGIHVFCGVLALLWVLVRSLMGAYNAQKNLGVDICLTYWFFVVGLWPILFGLIYF